MTGRGTIFPKKDAVEASAAFADFLNSNASNHKFHLRNHHQITEESKGKQQLKLELKEQRFSKEELEVLACCESLRPFNWVEKKYFRLAFSPSIKSAEWHARALSHHKPEHTDRHWKTTRRFTQKTQLSISGG